MFIYIYIHISNMPRSRCVRRISHSSYSAQSNTRYSPRSAPAAARFTVLV